MEDIVVSYFREAIVIICYASLPTLLTALFIGFGISFLQAATQIQEQTLSYVPKILAVFFVLMVSFSWMMQLFIRFAEKILINFNRLIG
jgi:flagellar biosynthesis protein FliQ